MTLRGGFATARPAVLVAVVIVLLVTVFWWPALFNGKTHFIGDAIGHGLPLLDLHARALHGDGHLLWSDNIYGGHPLFAEGQGAFAHPLNIIFALLVPPLHGASLFHFAGMLLMAWGTFGLCRCLGTSSWAAGSGALVAVFSGYSIGAHHNMTIGGTAVWLPWIFWGMESWLQRPTAARAALWGAACALCILAGYPHLFHGAVIYMACSLLPRLGFATQRTQLQWRAHVPTLLLAMLLCAGMAAVQVLPLLELAEESHRSSGTFMLPSSEQTRAELLRGMLYSVTSDHERNAHLVIFIGSITMSAAIVLSLLAARRAVVLGHIVAAFVLLQLSMGSASPLFVFIHEYNLIPGLQYFRWSWPYLLVAITGMAVLAAAGTDALAHALRRDVPHQGLRRIAVVAIVTVIAVIAIMLYNPAVSPWSPLLAVVAAAVVLALFSRGRAQWLPAALFAVLALEAALQHAREFQFGDIALLAPPKTREAMAEQDDLRLYRTYYLPGTLLLYPLADGRMPGLPEFTSSARGIFSHLTGLMYDVPSFSGALALPLKRRALLEPQIMRELHGDAGVAVPGLRVIDLLSLRYVAVEHAAPPPGFDVAFQDPVSNWRFLKNAMARPRIQTYTRARAVATLEGAVQALQAMQQDELIIETTDGIASDAHDDVNRPDAIRWRLRSASAMKYVIDVEADRDGWVFVADANYPGWSASVDGAPARVFSAQVLGKAVAVRSGHHEVVIRFEPASFRYGCIASVTALVIAVAFVFCAWWRAASFKRA